MKRVIILSLVLGPLVILFAGCASQAQMNMQRALFAQEYRQLEDELFQAYQNMERLARSNAMLRAQLEQDNPGNGGRSLNRSNQRWEESVDLAPISTEGLSPSDGIPDILQTPSSSRPQVRPLPYPVEQAQYLDPEFATRPRRPTGNTAAELPIWRPNR